MTDLERLDAALSRYLRPETFPIAVRMLRAGEPAPGRAKRRLQRGHRWRGR